MVNNFILVHYERHCFENAPKHLRNRDYDFATWNGTHKALLKNQIKSISKLYPDSKIHVLTNMHLDANNVFLHHEDLPSNHLCKFKIYSLLDEPAMFLDTDVCLKRPFDVKHLKCNEYFNLYNKYMLDHQILSPKKLPFRVLEGFNTAAVWIPFPDKSVTSDLIRIHNEFFSDLDFLSSKNRWGNNDEPAVSFYVRKHGLRMNLCPEVAGDVHTLSLTIDYQSIHYPGIEAKKRLLEESVKLY